jgi:hypothetical protein
MATPRTQATRKCQPRDRGRREGEKNGPRTNRNPTPPSTQPHRQPNHHQKINKGEGRASYGEQRERTEKRERAQTEVRREKKTGEMRWKEEKKGLYRLFRK